jgi:hypothetical protein
VRSARAYAAGLAIGAALILPACAHRYLDPGSVTLLDGTRVDCPSGLRIVLSNSLLGDTQRIDRFDCFQDGIYGVEFVPSAVVSYSGGTAE